jgi:hypothetical protein
MEALMGTDIHGWIEFQSHEEWWAVVDAGCFLPRTYGMFGLLFGIQDTYGFEPVVPMRGIPVDASDVVVAKYLEFDDNHDPTWITCAEMNGIDWDYEVISVQEYQYGAWKFHSHIKHVEGTEWESEGHGKPYEQDGARYRVVNLKRKVFQGEKWMLVVKWMSDLSALYGADNVCLVVWFDS